MNTFDLQAFLDRLETGECDCGGGGGFMMMDGEGAMTAEEAGQLFLEYVDASFIGNFIDRIGDLIEGLSGAAAKYWERVKEYLEN